MHYVEPIYVRGGQDRPVISTAAYANLREHLQKTTDKTDMYSLAQTAVKLQLENWEKSKKRPAPPELDLETVFGTDAADVMPISSFGAEPLADVKTVVEKIKSKTGDEPKQESWAHTSLPFVMRQAGMRYYMEDGKLTSYTDEWTAAPTKVLLQRRKRRVTIRVKIS